jgi:poly(3-hydroxybutyrate) depolymerase
MSPLQQLLRLFFFIILTTALTGCDFGPFDDDDDDNNPPQTGVQTMKSNGVKRSYYLLLPEENPDAVSATSVSATSSSEELKPLIVGFHGSFASHLSWIGETNRYGLTDFVGNDAIMVFPDALPLSEDNINWNFDYDFLFFEDLLAELERRGVSYDPNRLFVVGHSSGAGMANEIGCRYGDIVRAIAVSSGSLTSGGACIGSVGVIQTQGEADQAVPYNVGASAINFWAGYNGHDAETTIPGVIEPCIDYANIAFPNENYPVQWCQHSGGHTWTSFNTEAYWKFFSGLPTALPSMDHPPGGGNKAAIGDNSTTVSFTLRYPADMAPVTSGAITLYDTDFAPGDFASPDIFLQLNWDPNEQAPGGQVIPGTEVTYSLIPIKYRAYPFDTSVPYQLAFSVYVEGGSRPIPTPGVDLMVLKTMTFTDRFTPVVVSETLDLEYVLPW